MRPYLDKIGSFGSVLAAAACPACFPKLALLGSLLGLGALSAYEAQLIAAVQVLVVLAVLGHGLAYLQHRSKGRLGLALSAGAAALAGIYTSEALAYAGFAGLVAASAADLWQRLARRRRAGALDRRAAQAQGRRPAAGFRAAGARSRSRD